MDDLEQMRLFYLAYPPQRISETLSRNKAQVLTAGQSGTPSRNITLEQLAQAMPLSWSHYVRLVRSTRTAELSPAALNRIRAQTYRTSGASGLTGVCWNAAFCAPITFA